MPGYLLDGKERCVATAGMWVSVQEGLEEGVRSGVCWVHAVEPLNVTKACGLCSV